MKSLVSAVKGFLRGEEGATAVEYGILIALIAAAIVIIVYWVGKNIQEAFNVVCKSLTNLVGGSCG